MELIAAARTPAGAATAVAGRLAAPGVPARPPVAPPAGAPVDTAPAAGIPARAVPVAGELAGTAPAVPLPGAVRVAVLPAVLLPAVETPVVTPPAAGAPVPAARTAVAPRAAPAGPGSTPNGRSSDRQAGRCATASLRGAPAGLRMRLMPPTAGRVTAPPPVAGIPARHRLVAVFRRAIRHRPVAVPRQVVPLAAPLPPVTGSNARRPGGSPPALPPTCAGTAGPAGHIATMAPIRPRPAGLLLPEPSAPAEAIGSSGPPPGVARPAPGVRNGPAVTTGTPRRPAAPATAGHRPVPPQRVPPQPVLPRPGTRQAAAGHRASRRTTRPPAALGLPGAPRSRSRPAPTPNCWTRRSVPSCAR